MASVIVTPSQSMDGLDYSPEEIKVEVDDSDVDDDLYDGPCLICSESCEDALTIGAFIGGSFCLNRHLWSIFMLRNVLKFPKEECEKLLASSKGKNPGDWCKLCGPCSEYVSQALVVHCEILRLEKEMQDIQNALEGRLKLSLCSEWDSDSSLYERNVIREYYKDHLYPLEKEPSKKGMDKGYMGECSKGMSSVSGMTRIEEEPIQSSRPPLPPPMEKTSQSQAQEELDDVIEIEEPVGNVIVEHVTMKTVLERENIEIANKVLEPVTVQDFETPVVDVEANNEKEVRSDRMETEAVHDVPNSNANNDQQENLQMTENDETSEGLSQKNGLERMPSPRKEIRKKEANRKAATRYRQRKKLQLCSTVEEEEQLQKRYDDLVKERDRIWREIVTIRGLLRNMLYTNRRRRHTISSFPSMIPPIPTRRLGVIVSSSVIDTCAMRPAYYKTESYHLGNR